MAEDADGHSHTGKSEWIDISLPLHDKMVYWPVKDAPKIEIVKHPDKNSPITLWELTMKSHTGTHVDAPRHFIPDGATIDEMPLDAIIGPARVIEIKDSEAIRPAELEPYDIQPGERILFKTQNSSKCYKTDELVEDYVNISIEAAHFLADKKISVVGIDYIAIGNLNDWDNLIEVHETLLGKGVWVLEAIDLSKVEAGPCELICLPLRLKGGDASPARAIVRPL
jgi:arylformamidase